MADTRFTLEDAERYLLSLELFGMRFGLERMRRLMTVLDSPQERFAAAHVLGTNGKSSTARMIAALLRNHGVRTGAYLSPHLASFAERVEIDGRQVSPDRFAAAVGRAARAAALVNRAAGPDDHVTQFEALTAAAYWELGQAEVRAAAIEAGLGGRYDATSVIAPEVQVLTNVSLEHTRWLGPTERHITEEKLALVRPGGVLVTGRLGTEAARVAESVAADRSATAIRLGREIRITAAEPGAGRLSVSTPGGIYRNIRLRALGRFQRENFALAVAAAEALATRVQGLGFGPGLDEELVRATAAALQMPGRMEIVSTRPLVIFDGAHNPAGAQALRVSLADVVGDRGLVAVVSILEDKDAAGILSELAPVCAGVVFTRVAHAGALPPATLASLWRQLGGPPATIEPQPAAALAAAAGLAGPDGAVLVTGSLYLLSQLMRERSPRHGEAAGR